MDPETEELNENDVSEDKPKLSGRRKKAAKAKQAKPGSFETMGLSIPVLKAIKRKGFQLPTPIQRKTIPLIMQGLDVVGMAVTGSGKTAAFVIPIIDKLVSHDGTTGCRAVFIAPIRELALQTYKVITEIARNTNLRSAVLVGGDSMSVQFAELSAAPDIIVATPGRLLHHLEEIPGFTLKNVKHIVLDEADRLFEMGLAPQVLDILKQTSESRQTLLFSATLPAAMAEFAAAGLRSPQVVRLDVDTKLSSTLSLNFFSVREPDKSALLLLCLQELLPQDSPTLVFVATKHRVEFLQLLLEQAGIKCSAVYGSMDQAARKISVGKLRAGRSSVLLVTDVAARGIDIPTIDNVINFDYPAKPKLFVHRTGRAARAGRVGTAYSFVSPEDIPFLIDTHLFLSRALKTVPLDGMSSQDSHVSAHGDTTSWLGGVPEGVLDIAVEQVRCIIAKNASIKALEQPCENAFGLYRKTRPAASVESIKRARLLPACGPHFLLNDVASELKIQVVQADDARAAITRALSGFRPSATVLEAQVAAGRSGCGAGFNAVPGVRACAAEAKIDVMAAKRAEHKSSIAAHHSAAAPQSNEFIVGSAGGDGEAGSHVKTPKLKCWVPDVVGSGGTGRFRDSEFFISTESSSRHADAGYAVGEQGRGALAANVLDLTGEDASGMQAQRRQKVWDNKKKRYVTLQKDEKMKAGKRVKDGGSGADKSKKGKKKETGEMYKQWLKNVGKKAGGAAAVGGAGGSSQLAGRFKYGGRGWTNEFKASRPNQNIKNDLKSESEMRKSAAKKDKMRKHLASKSPGVSKKSGKKKR